jgi:hypothetical protein
VIQLRAHPPQIQASVLWQPPTAMVSAFSLQSSYTYTAAASAIASGLQATFPLPAPVGDICLRFAAGAITQCSTAGSAGSAHLKAQQKLFSTNANHTAVLAERASGVRARSAHTQTASTLVSIRSSSYPAHSLTARPVPFPYPALHQPCMLVSPCISCLTPSLPPKDPFPPLSRTLHPD